MNLTGGALNRKMFVRLQQNKRLHNFLLGIFIAAVSCLMLAPPNVYAETSDKPTAWMSTSVGFGGYYKKEDWVPVTVTIHHIGKEKTGKLVAGVSEGLSGNRRLTGEFQWSINLPTDGWMTTEIDLPGNVISSAPTLTLRSGGKALYATTLTGNAVSNVALVAVLSKQNQDTQFLAGSSDHSNPVLPIAVNPDFFPTQVNALNGLTAVVTSAQTLSSMNSAQASALKSWVELGGLMIVTSTGTTGAIWKNELPLQTGVVKKAPSKDLTEFVSGVATLPQSSISVKVGGIGAKARLWAGTNQVPVLASMAVGQGQVWQTAFSPMDSTLLGWSGNPQMWTTVLQLSGGSTSALQHFFNESGALSLTSVGDALAPLRIPSLPIFAFVFAGYLCLIGLVFFVLRRIHRAHLAWVILPLISCLTTVIIYEFGGAQRPKGLLTDGVGVMDLNSHGGAESYGVQAFMSPYPGGLDFAFPKQTLAVPMSVRELTVPQDAVVDYSGDTSVSFRNVGRWHVRYLYAAGVVNGVGDLQTSFTSAYGLLFGQVTNNTTYTLSQVAVIWKNRMYRLGTLKPGQTLTIHPTQETQTSQWISDYGVYNRALTHGIGRSLGAYLAQFSTSYTNSTGQGNRDATTPVAMIVATTNERSPQLPTPVHTQDVSSDKTLVFVRQFADVEPGIGDALQ